MLHVYRPEKEIPMLLLNIQQEIITLYSRTWIIWILLTSSVAFCIPLCFEHWLSFSFNVLDLILLGPLYILFYLLQFWQQYSTVCVGESKSVEILYAMKLSYQLKIDYYNNKKFFCKTHGGHKERTYSRYKKR